MQKGNPGLGRKYRYWAERLVRTETQAAYNHVHQGHVTGIAADLKPHGVLVEKRWDASLDMRVCKDCRRMHGAVVATAGNFTVGKRAVRYPPAHPNCRCCLVAFVRDLDQPTASVP